MVNWLNNTFDTCKFISHSTNPEQIISECTNKMHEIDRLFVWTDKFVMCKYHYCAVLVELAGGTHKTISCSGAMMGWGDPTAQQVFNPISNQDMHLSFMHTYPVEWPLSGKDYYYIKDTRMSFPDNVVNINCTDDFKTCFEFETGTSQCLGNTEDIPIIDSTFSFIIGVNVAVATAAMIFFGLGIYIKRLGRNATMLIYFFPLLGIALVMRGFLLLSLGPYVAGNILVIYLFPTIYLSVSSMRDAEKRRRVYKKIDLADPK